MQDGDLFLEIAAIAGVFVGFGALIAVRSGGASGRIEVGYMRGVVSIGALTIVAALAPVTLARYDLTEHEVWVLSSAIVVIGWVVFFVVNARTQEYRANWAADLDVARTGQRSRWPEMVNLAAFFLYLLVMFVVPIVIVLGMVPELEAAFYFTEVVLILAGAGWTLLLLVYAQRTPVAT